MCRASAQRRRQTLFVIVPDLSGMLGGVSRYLAVSAVADNLTDETWEIDCVDDGDTGSAMACRSHRPQQGPRWCLVRRSHARGCRAGFARRIEVQGSLDLRGGIGTVICVTERDRD